MATTSKTTVDLELLGSSCGKGSTRIMPHDEDDKRSLNPNRLLSNEEEGYGGDNHEAEIVSRSRELQTSLKEYVYSYRLAEFLLCLMFVIIGIILEKGGIEPNQRPIPYQQLESTGEYILDQTVNHPSEGETVSVSAALVYTFIIPLIIQLILCHFIEKYDTVHRTFCVYLAGFGLTLALTNSVKLYVGYLRPVFYNVCQPDDDYQECTNDARGARLSFPSGHASLSFCGLVLFSFFLERQFGVSRLRIWAHDSSTGQIIMGYKQHVGMRRIVSIFCYSPILLAGFIAASRVVDNKHFPADVVGGSVLGTAVASLVYSIWFPSWPCLDVEGSIR